MTRSGGSGEPPPRADDPGEDVVEVEVRAEERYYRLEGVIFRVRMDRLEQGAEYLRKGRWVWTPITSGSVIGNPNASPLSPIEAQPYRAIR
jgi:hypothetical protein